MMYNNYSQDYDLQNQAKEHKTGSMTMTITNKNLPHQHTNNCNLLFDNTPIIKKSVTYCLKCLTQ